MRHEREVWVRVEAMIACSMLGGHRDERVLVVLAVGVPAEDDERLSSREVAAGRCLGDEALSKGVLLGPVPVSR